MQMARQSRKRMSIHDTASRGLRFCLAGLAFVLAATAHGTAQSERRQLNLEWIYGPEGRSVASVPQTAWLDDGSLIILDNRRAARERTLEKLNPRNGQRAAIVDPVRALADLKAVAGVETETLPWPIAFDGMGRRALYIFKGDVFTLELAESHFLRLTATPPEETSAGFSPNGRRVAYVRDHDLFFFDLDNNRETRVTRDGSETLLNGTLSWVYWEEVFGRRDIGYWWAPDSQAIAYLQSDESQMELSYFTDIAPFPPRVVRQRYARAGGPNPRVRLGIVELETPNTTWIQIKDPFEYIVRAKWLPDGHRLSLETMPRIQTEMSLYFVDRKSGAATR